MVSPVFAVVAGRPQKGLTPPGLEVRHQGGAPVGRQRPGGADHRPVKGLRGPQVVQVYEAHALHLAHETLVAVIDLDVAGHRPDLPVVQQRGHQVAQGIWGDDAVGIDGDERPRPPAPGESGVKPLFLAPVGGKPDGPQEVGVAPLGLLNIKPGVIGGAVVDADDFHPVGRVIGGSYRGDGFFNHGPFIVGRDDDRETGQWSGCRRIRLVAGPKDRAAKLKDEHHQGVAGSQGGQEGGVGLAAQELRIGLKGAELNGQNHENDDHGWNQHLESRIDPGWRVPPQARQGRAAAGPQRLPGQGWGAVGHETGRSSWQSLSKSWAIGQQKRPGCNLPENIFPGTSGLGCSADGSRAARPAAKARPRHEIGR